MKRLWSCFLVMLCILMIMTGCRSKAPVNEESSNDSPTQSETPVTDEKDKDGQKNPTSSTPKDPTEENDGIVEGYGHRFYKNSDGKVVVEQLVWDGDRQAYTTKTIRYFEPVTPTAETLSQIKEGMSIFEVVELVGIPHINLYAASPTLWYECEDGRWQVNIDKNDTREFVVYSYYCQDLMLKALKVEVGMTYAEVKELMESDGKELASGKPLYEWDLGGTHFLYVQFEQPSGTQDLEDWIVQIRYIDDKIVV